MSADAPPAKVAAVYLRQSLDRQKDMLAITRQRGPCLELCAARGWTPREYVDNDVSASKGKRKAYNEMLRDIEAGTVDAIVVWDLDRLYRRPVELEHLIELADRYQLKLATVTGDVDLSTDNGRLFARIKGAVARAEVERKSERQKAAGLQRAQAGKKTPGITPFGFTADGDLHPIEAPVVRAAYEDLLAGISLRSIARSWNEAGYRTPFGKAWTTQALSKKLRAPRYGGLREYRGEIVGPMEKPGVIDENTWHAAQALLLDDSRRPRNSGGRRYVGTGLYVCGHHEHRPKLITGSSLGRVAYKCPECYVSRNQEGMDDHVLGLVAARLSMPDAAALLVRSDAPNLDAVRTEVAGYQSRLDALANEFAEGDLTASQLRTATARLREKIAAAEALIADSVRHRVFAGVIGADDVDAALRELPVDRQRAIVAALMVVVLHRGARGGRGFRPDGIEVEWVS